MAQWEYTVVEIAITERWSAKKQVEEVAKFESAMNEMGAQGWELVTYQAVPIAGGMTRDKIKRYAYLGIFKRPIGD